MKANDIGAVIIEPGASLDYFTGVQWWRSERLTGTVSDSGDASDVYRATTFSLPS